MNKVVVIENLPIDKNSAQITEMLSGTGKVNWIYLQPETGTKPCNTAYVEMANKKDAARVIVRWNGAECDERILRVKYVNPGFNPTYSRLSRIKALTPFPPFSLEGKPVTIENVNFHLIDTNRWQRIIWIVISLSLIAYIIYNFIY